MSLERTKKESEYYSQYNWGRLVTDSVFKKYLGDVGRTTRERIAKEAGAVRYFGTRKLIDLKCIDIYLDSLIKSGNGLLEEE